MTQEDKELLLRDLSARLRYGVKVQKLNEPESAFEVYAIDIETTQISFIKYKGKSLEIYDIGILISPNNFLRFKLYLRPMSSMTEEERKEIGILIREKRPNPYGIINNEGVDNLLLSVSVTSTVLIDWLNAHQFDYRGLIEKGLSIEAPEGMYVEQLKEK